MLSAVVDLTLPSVRDEPRRLPSSVYHVLAVVGVALAVGALTVFGLNAHGLAAAVFCLALSIVTAADLEYRLIPNRVVLPATAIVLPLQTLSDPSPEWLVAAAGAGGALFLLALVYPAGIGMGDVKLAALMGAVLGRAVLPALVLATFLSALPAIALLLRHGRAGRTMGIPFGPFLAAGSIVVLFAGA
jgi:leader peptidase (prepilin peptidase)/N-methyltransferase